MIVTIDDQDFTKSLRTTGDFELTVRRDATHGATSYVFSSALTFDKDGFNYLANNFFGGPSCVNNESKVVISLNCPKPRSFEFLINTETIRIDPIGCVAEINLLQYSASNQAFDLLRRNPFWGTKVGEDNSFTLDKHPIIGYCEPINLWNKIVNVLTLGLIKSDGCSNEYHRTPRINRIMEFNADRAGLTWRSDTVFSLDLYKNCSLLMAQNRSGFSESEVGTWIWDNAPLITVVDLLDLLKPVFNAEYSIGGGEMRFETVRYWNERVQPFFDLNSEYAAGRIETAPFIQYSTDRNRAYGRFEYAQDASDVEGNRSRPFYNDFIEWNPAGLTCLKGEKRVQLEFSTPLISFSEQWVDMVESFTNRNNRNAQYGIPVGLLILEKGMSSQLKLINYDQVLNLTSFISRKNLRDHPSGQKILDFNYQMSFRENEPQGLYKQFYEYSAPTQRREIDIDAVTWRPPDIGFVLDALNQTGLNVGFITSFGCAKAEELRINLTAGTVTFIKPKIVK